MPATCYFLIYNTPLRRGCDNYTQRKKLALAYTSTMTLKHNNWDLCFTIISRVLSSWIGELLFKLSQFQTKKWQCSWWYNYATARSYLNMELLSWLDGILVFGRRMMCGGEPQLSRERINNGLSNRRECDGKINYVLSITVTILTGSSSAPNPLAQ